MSSLKTYSIELYFDPTAAEVIRRLWDKVRAIAPSMASQLHARPHISLAVLPQGNSTEKSNADLERLPPILAGLSAVESCFEIQFSSVGLFPTGNSVVFLAPVVTETLLSLHHRFHQALAAAQIEVVPYYRPQVWVPHCTIARQLEPRDLLAAVETVCRQDTFLKAQICEIGLVEASPVRQICTFPLEGAGKPPI